MLKRRDTMVEAKHAYIYRKHTHNHSLTHIITHLYTQTHTYIHNHTDIHTNTQTYIYIVMVLPSTQRHMKLRCKSKTEQQATLGARCAAFVVLHLTR